MAVISGPVWISLRVKERSTYRSGVWASKNINPNKILVRTLCSFLLKNLVGVKKSTSSAKRMSLGRDRSDPLNRLKVPSADLKSKTARIKLWPILRADVEKTLVHCTFTSGSYPVKNFPLGFKRTPNCFLWKRNIKTFLKCALLY